MNTDDILKPVASIMLQNHQLRTENQRLRDQIETTIQVLRELQSEVQRMQTLIHY